jgi:hypothetical protein
MRAARCIAKNQLSYWTLVQSREWNRLLRPEFSLHHLVGEHEMMTMKTLGLAVGIAFAASSFAFAQQGNTGANAAASGGAGTHQNSLRTGSAASTQKNLRNQQGYRQASRKRIHPLHHMRMQVRHPVTGKRLHPVTGKKLPNQ